MCASSERRCAASMSTSTRSCVVVLGLLCVYVAYLVFGALVFSALEKPVEEKVQAELNLLKQQLLSNMSCINISTLEQLLQTLLNANKYGVSLDQNTSQSSNWDLASALFFSNTLVTTIGESDSGFTPSWANIIIIIIIILKRCNVSVLVCIALWTLKPGWRRPLCVHTPLDLGFQFIQQSGPGRKVGTKTCLGSEELFEGTGYY